MASKIKLEIRESKSELELLRKESKSQRKKTRILFLLLKLESRYKSQKALSEYLNVNESTIYRWSKTYKESGLKQLMHIPLGGKRREVVTSLIHKGLKDKLADSENALLGYNDAVNWVEKNYSIRLKYNTLRTYMKRHFGTKLKVPRKSHYKKDEQAIKVFKKLSC
jgi:transposase